MELLEIIKSLVEANTPGYKFQFETSKMMNVLADDSPFPCVFFEEYTDGGITLGYGYDEKRIIELSFMDLSEFQDDAIEREKIRERMKREAVFPFVKAFNGCGEFEHVREFTLVPEPPRFDANAVSLLLRFEVRFKNCL